RDPELDEPITDLKFISDLRVGDGAVDVRLRLPTPFCAPNFAYLMAHDAREALLSVPGVREARVVLDDHHTADEINAGMAGGLGFEGTFSSFEETGEDLDGLRAIFRRKAFISRQERLCRALLADGYSPAELAGMRLEDVPSSEAKEKYLSRREELGLDISADASFVVDPDGRKIPEEAVMQHLRFARVTRLSIEANAGFCRGVLAARHGIKDPEEETA
ncbi:MAG: iron-sulfur cluster assembly protein, partial [Actinomycetota bacterium]|nr:iron-sulfur cluster assembly protein [Actinomycetota bacterium]